MADKTHDYAQTPTSSKSSISPPHTATTDVDAQRLPFPDFNVSQTSMNGHLRPHVQIDDSSRPRRESNVIHSPSSNTLRRAGTGFSVQSGFEGMKRRPRRSNTAYTYKPAERHPGWEPGQEPGIDTSDPAPPYGGEPSDPDGPTHLDARCEITVIDWSQDNMESYRLDNDNLAEFVSQPKPSWVICRWINVNGLSWDVIRQLGSHKGLHRLAIEDLMNTRNRTKADFYGDHTYMVLPVQKLINLHSPDDCDSDDEDHEPRKEVGWRKKRHQTWETIRKPKGTGAIASLFREILRPREKAKLPPPARINSSNGFAHSSSLESPWAPHPIRSLQRYLGGPNEDRTEFMERHAVLASKGLGVAMEQVSIFLNSDNTVTSFFESSAEDVEIPIIKRLQLPETILRQSCDASMLTQAIIDTIIDMAIPVTRAYQDAIGDIELSVLTDPDIHQSTALYILTTEINVLRNAMAPISALINALKDHKSDPVGPPSSPSLRPQLTSTPTNTVKPVSSGVPISALTHTYLGDIEDHIELTVASYDSMRRSADNLVDLIFNTIGAYQNESMKQLTIVTCMFLPLSFLTGYFGMNFTDFRGIENSDSYFWKIAIPFAFATVVLLLKDAIGRFFVRTASKRLIKVRRKRRDEKRGGDLGQGGRLQKQRQGGGVRRAQTAPVDDKMEAV